MQIPVVFIAFANDKVDYARYLRNLPKEQDGIRKALFEAQQAGLCEVVERANATLEQLLDVFQNKNYTDRIAIFHYGGHADGYQLLLEQLDGSHAVAHGGGLVSFFAKQNGLKLVFFNGCSTQQQALELSAAGVSAVVGTSQSINDDVATALAIRFYKGLGQGHTLERAWNEALDEIKLQYGDQNKGLYRLKKGEAPPDQLPWNLVVREGAEQVRNWNLPEAVDNPLFGLPEIPRKFNLPEPPFLFLRRYERPHAEIFFGRSFYTRDLYNRITDQNAAPVIFLYGQSGVGKSSLLDAGLLPRLEEKYEVRYIRRVRNEGLLGTLYLAMQDAWEEKTETPQNEPIRHDEKIISAQKAQKIKQLETLAQDLDSDLRDDIQNLIKKLAEKTQPEQNTMTDYQLPKNKVHEKGNLKKYWHFLEERYQKPLVLILDQVEEMLTQPNEKLRNEFDLLLEELKNLFADPSFVPKGKIILSYRKEYHPEIEEGFKTFSIPRERVFLKHLSRKDIVEVIQGLASNERLKHQYRLQIDTNLPVIIADDLLEDRDSSIAPVLQILLTKMWQRVEKDEIPVFSIDLYQKLKSEGILMNDFFDQQIEKLREWNAEVETSGLALSVLNLHTTPIGTSKTVIQEDLFKRYSHLADQLPSLLLKFKELYLLTDAPNATSLGHDTLAPLIAREFQRSDRRGQRAARIIISKAVDFEKDEKNLIDPADLRIVENGLTGMRILNEVEERLLALSKKRRNRLRQIRRLIQAAFGFLFILITASLFYAQYESRVAREQRQRAEFESIKADSASKIASLKEKEAIQKGKEAIRSAEIASQKQQEAIKSAKIATLKEQEAKESAIKAQASEQESKASEEKAIISKKEAEGERQVARISTIDAEIAQFASDLSSEESRYGTYKAKAKELAVQSVAINESPDLKIVLALNAYQLNDYAYTRLDQELNRIWRSYTRFTEKQTQEGELRGYAKNIGRNVRATYDRLKALAQNRQTSSQIFEALRKAYLRNNPIKQDFLFDAESWELARLENQKIVLNSKKGEVIITSLADINPSLLPLPSEVYNLTPNQTFQYNSIAETPQGIYVGGKNGQIKFFSRGTISEVRQIGTYRSSILSMVYMPLISTLAFSYENKVVLQNTALNTKQQIDIPQTSGVRHLTLIEEDKNTYLLAADNNGTLSMWDAKQPEKGFTKLNVELGKSAIQTMHFFKNAKVLLVGNSKGEVFIVLNFSVQKAQNGENFTIQRNLWHRGMVKEVAISPDKRFFATAGFDGMVQMWRVGNDWVNHLKKQPDLVIQESSKILSLTFDAKSEYLIFNDEEKLRICPTNPTEFYKKLCLQKTRDLTSDEWNVYMGEIKPAECAICK